MNAMPSSLTSNRPESAAIVLRDRMIRETERFVNTHLQDDVAPWPRRHQHREQDTATEFPLRRASGE